MLHYSGTVSSFTSIFTGFTELALRLFCYESVFNQFFNKAPSICLKLTVSILETYHTVITTWHYDNINFLLI